MNISRKITAFVLTLCLLFSSLTLAALNVGAEENTLLGEPVSLADDSSTESDIFGYILPQDNQKISLVPVSSDGATDVSSISWTLENGVLTISGDGDMPAYSSTYPAPWSSERHDITTLVVEKGITSIGVQAFSQYYNLTSITLPEGLTKIDEAAFFGSNRIESINIPESVKTIDKGAFADCTSLTSVICPGVESIGDYAFQNTALSSFAIGKDTQLTPLSFYSSALENYILNESNPHYSVNAGILYSKDGKTLLSCPASSTADEISIPFGVETIGESAFVVNSTIKAVDVPDSVTYINRYSFYNSVIESVTIGSGLKSIPYRAFGGCNKLSNVIFKEGIEAIDAYAFQYCSNLTQVTLPKSTLYIHSSAFPDSTKVVCLNTELDEFGDGGYTLMEKFKVSYEKRYDFAFEVLELVNIERSKLGLAPLTMNAELLETAMLRAAEISVYYDHTRPDFNSCFTASPLMAAENIAAGYATPKDVVEGWMNSPGHRANILCADFTVIGIGCADVLGGCWWTQCFGVESDTENCAKPENVSAFAPISIPYYSYSDGKLSKSPYEFYIRYSRYYPSLSDEISVSLHINVLGWEGRITPVISDNVTWSSSPDEVGAVNDDLTLTFHSPGTLTVSAKLKHFETSANLEIRSRGILGDANCDGTVNVKDATHIQKHVANILEIGGLDREYLADANGDGEINIKDATVIQKYVANIDTGFNIGNAV